MPHHKEFRNAIFVVTEERSCPIYNVGEELHVEDACTIFPEAKPVCMILVEKLMGITERKKGIERLPQFAAQRAQFDCGGCQGLLRFAYKKEKGFATLQMKLFSETEERRKKLQLDQFFGKLRKFQLFESLDDEALLDLTELLDLKKYPKGKIVLKQGEPGTHLFILLSGSVGVIGDDGQRLAEMGKGDIFGEMSLLSGDPVSYSIHSLLDTEAALLSVKNFKFVLKKNPVLQLFLLKMLVDRVQAMALRSGNITSGMSGELSEVGIVELFQLINSSQKTGRINFIFDGAKATVYFNEGEFVKVRYKELTDKEALFALLAKRNGHFSYSKGLPTGVKSVEPFGGFMGLIMEGVQSVNEQELNCF